MRAGPSKAGRDLGHLGDESRVLMKYVTTVGEQRFEIEVLDEHHVAVNGVTFEVDFEAVGDQPVYSLLLAGQSHEAYVVPSEEAWQVLLNGRFFPVQVDDERTRRLQQVAGSGASERNEFHLKAPMPGLVVAVPVSEGQEVQKGDVLVILESMKMQNELRSARAGVVTRLRVKAGDHVEQRQTLLSVE